MRKYYLPGYTGFRFCPQSSTTATTETSNQETSTSRAVDTEFMALICGRREFYIRCYIDTAYVSLSESNTVCIALLIT
ncbi:hypothetical protein DPMN_069224 [Dreissena polymorpha]|uniref:Uncharacterized protein n=1 Tax=Dreissena polymorpha TaxID=45954 RepID=A0A9D4BU62_DREPO|nr:hypothetical protein DPMN_069224 [Dreissena polymorpha]